MSNNRKKHLESLQKSVNLQIDALEKQFPNDIEPVIKIGKELNQLGVNSENTYLFIQGHTIENSVILAFLQSLCTILRSNKEGEIIANAKHEEEKRVELNHYRNNLIDVEKALKSNTEYKSCFLYEKIKLDLDNYMRKIKN